MVWIYKVLNVGWGGVYEIVVTVWTKLKEVSAKWDLPCGLLWEVRASAGLALL